jgi:CBS domain-containing protein
MTEYHVGEIMRTDIGTLTEDVPIRRAVAHLLEARAAAAAVIGDDGRLAGILTQKDCFRPALHASYYREWKGCVAEHMSRDVITVDVEDNVIQVAELFLSSPHRVFPVLSDTRVAGLVQRSAVLGLLVRNG